MKTLPLSQGISFEMFELKNNYFFLLMAISLLFVEKSSASKHIYQALSKTVLNVPHATPERIPVTRTKPHASAADLEPSRPMRERRRKINAQYVRNEHSPRMKHPPNVPPCPPAQYTFPGASGCSFCAAGSSLSPSGCRNCNTGFFSDKSGTKFCKGCLDGTISGGRNGRGATFCKKCPPGTFRRNSKLACTLFNNSCIKCQPGTFSRKT